MRSFLLSALFITAFSATMTFDAPDANAYVRVAGAGVGRVAVVRRPIGAAVVVRAPVGAAVVRRPAGVVVVR